jgi:hypothetical protein
MPAINHKKPRRQKRAIEQQAGLREKPLRRPLRSHFLPEGDIVVDPTPPPNPSTAEKL